MKKFLKIVGITCLVLVVLLVGAVVAAAFLVDLDKIVNDQIAQQKPEIEKKLGRKVEVGRVSTQFFPRLGGRVENVTVGPDTTQPKDDRPLVAIQAVGFEVALWDAIVSLGKKVAVSSVYVDGLKVSLVRYPGGRLSYQDIVDRQPKTPDKDPTKEEPAAPMSPETQAYLRGVSVGEIRIQDAEFRLFDLDTPSGKPAESLIKKFNFRMKDVRVTDPIEVRADAAVFSEQKNFEFGVTIGPLPPDLSLQGTPRVSKLFLKMNEVDLARVAPYLGPSVPVRVDSASVSADYQIDELAPDKPVAVNGFVGARNLQLAGGQKLEVRLDSKLKADPKGNWAEVEKLGLQIGAVSVAMSGSFKDLTGAPKFQNLTVKTDTLNPEALLSYYPPARANLPKGLRLDGNVIVDVAGNGDANQQTLKALVDLAKVDILFPSKFVKPKGTPLAFRVDGNFSASDANLKELAFILDELELVAKGSVKNFKDPTLDLTFSAKPFSFDRLARLLPSVGEQLAGAKATASGKGQLSGHAKGTLTNLDANLDFSLAGVKLDVPGTRLSGDLSLKAQAQGNPKERLTAKVDFDADRALIQVKEVMNKAVTTPFHLSVDVARTAERLDVKKFDLRLAELGLNVSGGMDFPKGVADVKVDLQRLDLEKFSKTVTAIPADKAKNGFLDFQMALSGDPNRMETMRVDMRQLNAKVGRSDVHGQIAVQNLVKPDVEMKLQSSLLDLDELRGPEKETSEKTPAKEEEKKTPKEDDPSLKEYRFKGDFDLKRVVVKKEELTDFKGQVSLADGLLKLSDCAFGIYDGRISAKGTEAEIWRGRMPFVAKLVATNLDMNKALSAQTQYKDTLYGRANMNLDLKGRGFQTAELEEALTGTIDLALREGRLSGKSLTESVTGDLSALKKVPGLNFKPVGGSNAISDLDASFEVKEGKMFLKRPLVAKVDGNKVTLTGAIGIAGKLFLEGTYFLPGATVEKVSSGKCRSNEEMPVPIKIEGTAKSPEFRPNAGGIAMTLVDRCLKGAVADAVGDKLKKTLGVDVQAKDEAAARARAEAAAKQAEAQRQAQAAADQARRDAEAKARAEADRAAAEAERLRQEAERKRREAEAKAKREAEEKAKKALKNFGF